MSSLRSRLSASDRALLQHADMESMALRDNWPRRLQNALIALARSEPGWMAWVEREIDPQWELERITRLVEARTRAYYLRSHNYFGRGQIGGMLFDDRSVFTDEASLRIG